MRASKRHFLQDRVQEVPQSPAEMLRNEECVSKTFHWNGTVLTVVAYRVSCTRVLVSKIDVDGLLFLDPPIPAMANVEAALEAGLRFALAACTMALRG